MNKKNVHDCELWIDAPIPTDFGIMRSHPAKFVLKVRVGNDQEIVQSESNYHSNNRGGKYFNLFIFFLIFQRNGMTI